MIKLTKIAFVLMASIAMVFIGCKKDTTTSDLTLTVSQDRAIAHLGDTIPLTINASTTNDEIKSVTLTKTGGVSVTIPAVSSTSSYSKVINYIVSDSVGTLVFTITATGSLTSTPITKTLTFSIVKDVPITLGASTSSFPSFINGSTLTTYNAANAFANQGLVDLVYTYTTTDGAILASPSDPLINLPSWTTKNVTKIGKIMKETPDDVSMVTGTSVTNLAMGDMLGYITSTGVKGIIEVMDLTTGANGNVILTFMVIK